MTAAHTLNNLGGQIIKIDNEIMMTKSSGATSLTVVRRGDNGSTAASHLTSSVVYVWNVMQDVNALALEIALIMYRSRFGNNIETVSTVTAAGVIVTPRSLPSWANEVVGRYKRRVW
jgi:hypothetical protein